MKQMGSDRCSFSSFEDQWPEGWPLSGTFLSNGYLGECSIANIYHLRIVSLNFSGSYVLCQSKKSEKDGAGRPYPFTRTVIYGKRRYACE